MNTFPVTYCVRTKDLTKESYSDLICLMVSQGYQNLVANLTSIHLIQMWNYIGVTEYGSIEVYDKPYSYLKVNEWFNYLNLRDDEYHNILSLADLKGLI